MIKHYYPPATPCQRLLASEYIADDQIRGLQELSASLDPLQLLNEIRLAQSALTRLSAPDEATEGSSTDDDLALFLSQLPTLWRGGEARPTHRLPPASGRHWRTRLDPFVSVWPVVEGWLVEEPDATAKSLLERLQQEYPSTYTPGQLRTLQRRVRDWRRTMARKLIFGGANLEPGAPQYTLSDTSKSESDAAASVPGNITT